MYAWHDLPVWELPYPECDSRHTKSWWWQQKEEHGALCSYFDLFMRSCLKYALEKGVLPPDVYQLNLEADLSHVDVATYYPIECKNAWGLLTLISGAGTYDPEKGWYPPVECGAGLLCFHDANGAKGFINWSTYPGYAALTIDEDLIPQYVTPGGSARLYIKGGLGPFLFQTTSLGYSFPGGVQNYNTFDRFADLSCVSGCPDIDYDIYCDFTVLDACGTEVFWYIEPLPADDFEFDNDYTPDEIARLGNVNVKVKGGHPPYDWHVFGTGFTFHSTGTQEVIGSMNQIERLDADDTACGSAELIVFDSCADEVRGYVRCTTGIWSFVQTNWGCVSAEHDNVQCDDPGVSCQGGCNTIPVVIAGKYKWVLTILDYGSIGQYSLSQWMTEEGCAGDIVPNDDPTVYDSMDPAGFAVFLSGIITHDVWGSGCCYPFRCDVHEWVCE